MTPGILGRLRSVLGPAVTEDRDGRPRVTPDSIDGLAAVLGLASDEHWLVRVEGGRTWMPADASTEPFPNAAAHASVPPVTTHTF